MSLNANQLEQKAIQLQAKGKKEEALNIYKQLLQRDPSSRRFRKTIADIHMELGQTRQAERRYLEVVESMVKDGQFRMAVPIYKSLTKLRPKDQDMFIELADCLVKTDKNNAALENYAKAVEMTQRLKPEIAQKVQRKIIDLKPGDLTEQIRLGELLENANWMEKASDQWKKLANESRRIGKPDDQALFLERALSVREEWSVRRDAAKARLNSGNSMKALEHLKTIYKSYSSDPEVVFLLAQGLQSINQKAKASQVWLQAAEKYESTGNYEKQSQALQNAIECGIAKDTVEEKLKKALLFTKRTSICLTEQKWAQPRTERELELLVRSWTYIDYRVPEKAIALLRGQKKISISMRAALIEALIAQGEKDMAISELQSFGVTDVDVHEDINSKLLSLGVQVDSDDDIVDDLLEDDLMDDDLMEDDLVEDEELIDDDQASGPSVTDLEHQAEELVANGKIDAAIEVYGQILDLDPDHNSALLRIGELMSRSPTDTDDVSDDLLEDGDFTDIQPDDFSFELGNRFEDIDQQEEQNAATSSNSMSFAKESPAAAVSVDDDEILFNARAHLMVAMRRKAIKQLAGRTDLAAMCIVATAKFELDDLKEARNLIQDAIDDSSEDDPAYPEALWVLAKIYTEQERIRPALRTLNELESIAPGFRTRDVKAWKHGLDLL